MISLGTNIKYILHEKASEKCGGSEDDCGSLATSEVCRVELHSNRAADRSSNSDRGVQPATWMGRFRWYQQTADRYHCWRWSACMRILDFFLSFPDSNSQLFTFTPYFYLSIIYFILLSSISIIFIFRFIYYIFSHFFGHFVFS